MSFLSFAECFLYANIVKLRGNFWAQKIIWRWECLEFLCEGSTPCEAWKPLSDDSWFFWSFKHPPRKYEKQIQQANDWGSSTNGVNFEEGSGVGWSTLYTKFRTTHVPMLITIIIIIMLITQLESLTWRSDLLSEILAFRVQLGTDLKLFLLRYPIHILIRAWSKSDVENEVTKRCMKRWWRGRVMGGVGEKSSLKSSWNQLRGCSFWRSEVRQLP